MAFELRDNPLIPAKVKFDRKLERYSQMKNLITTRSDVFEIIVTGQAGYGTDENGDGRLNYRSDAVSNRRELQFGPF